MERIKKGNPAPYDGVILNLNEYSKYIADIELLNWVANKINKLKIEKQD